MVSNMFELHIFLLFPLHFLCSLYSLMNILCMLFARKKKIYGVNWQVIARHRRRKTKRQKEQLSDKKRKCFSEAQTFIKCLISNTYPAPISVSIVSVASSKFVKRNEQLKAMILSKLLVNLHCLTSFRQNCFCFKMNYLFKRLLHFIEVCVVVFIHSWTMNVKSN